MSVVVDIVEDTADFVGDVFESVGDVAEDVWDVVSDTASDVWDFVDANIIQPIKDDPITFIVSAAAYAFGIPGLSFAGPGTAASVGIATTGSRLAQGDDFDDAIKAGAMAGVTTGATNALGKGISTGGQDWSPNLYSTADELAANAARGAASGSAGAKGASISSSLDDAGRVASVGDDIARAATPEELLAKNLDEAMELPGYDRNAFPEYYDVAGEPQLVPKDKTLNLADADELLRSGAEAADMPRRGPYGADIPDEAAMRKVSAAGETPYKSSIDGQGSYSDIGKGRPAGFDDVDIGKTSDYTDIGNRSDPTAKPAPRGTVREPGVGDPGWEPPIEDRTRAASDDYMLDASGQPVKRTGLDSAKDLGGAVAERGGDWVWDGAKWVWSNPGDALMYGVAGLALLDSLGKDDPPDDDKGGGKDEDRQNADDLFYRDLQQLELQRARRDSQFGRSDNPYDTGGLYSYGEAQGEHQFYGPTVYTPVEYTQPVVQAAQGGSIGALNSQAPSYYRYGAMPMAMAMGGYASGGLKSVHEDGRSDHIPAMLSDGEYVIDAETVALLGNGSNEAGANRLEQMRQEIRKQKGKALSKGKFSSDAKSPLAYLKQRRG